MIFHNGVFEKLTDFLDAGYILKKEADEMFRRATLFPPLTYTETYREHYENCVDIIPSP
ncbi:hypothetical protein ABES02_02010 [Neobacillus pocheonensis]|uniref:hypothetical protein n=1 Tax=Neobacillus pocheonensis TaxID=363869 RepID=UPI003D2D5C30